MDKRIVLIIVYVLALVLFQGISIHALVSGELGSVFLFELLSLPIWYCLVSKLKV